MSTAGSGTWFSAWSLYVLIAAGVASGRPGSVPGYEASAGAGCSTLTRSGSCPSRVPNGLAFTPLSQ